MGLVKIYDTTLRDGSQGEGVSFTLEDKLKITKKLDEFGVDYIEGGWPGSNPKDEEYFRRIKDIDLKHARVTAFSSTRRANIAVEDDPNIQCLVECGTDIVTIFAKSWDFHVTDALEVSLEENLAMIYDTIKYLKDKGKTVFFDAEHFFDGYDHNAGYAMKTVDKAIKAGAEVVILCDTNGGKLTSRLSTVCKEVSNSFDIPLGIHAHNDGGVAVANSLAAFEKGVVQIQGTIGGLGERCGNADLCSIIPALKLKYDYELENIDLKKLRSTYYYVMEIANLIPENKKPYVGKSAFTHKGGIHVSALRKNPLTYEHIAPDSVGNKRRVLVSELAGKSNLQYKMSELGFDLNEFDKKTLTEITNTIKGLENEGYKFEAAEASFSLLIYRRYKNYLPFFRVRDFKIISHNSGSKTNSEAVIKIDVGGENVHTAAEGDGPVNALDFALRKALNDFYPLIPDMKLIDYKVRVLNGGDGTAAKVRVFIETSDNKNSWTTVGVSTNIIQASWQALVDSIEYGLLINNIKPRP